MIPENVFVSRKASVETHITEKLNEGLFFSVES
jgi:hypothetical protein